MTVNLKLGEGQHKDIDNIDNDQNMFTKFQGLEHGFVNR